MSQPLVSIVTPSFNQAAFLEETIRSVLAQEYPNLEYIVIDGGSTDGSVDIIRKYADRLAYWVSERDAGQSDAINKGFRRATGDIVAWLNSDDAYFTSTAVTEAVETFTRLPHVDLVYGHAALADADGRILQLLWVPPFSYRLLCFHNFIIQPAVFLRRPVLGPEFVDDAYEYCMDLELWLRLGRAHRFARVDKVLAIDRHHPDRKSYARLDLLAADFKRLAAAYGQQPAATLWRRGLLNAVKMSTRLMGIELLSQAYGKLAFRGIVDSRWRLAARQIAFRRAHMARRVAQGDADRN